MVGRNASRLLRPLARRVGGGEVGRLEIFHATEVLVRRGCRAPTICLSCTDSPHSYVSLTPSDGTRPEPNSVWHFSRPPRPGAPRRSAVQYLQVYPPLSRYASWLLPQGEGRATFDVPHAGYQ